MVTIPEGVRMPADHQQPKTAEKPQLISVTIDGDEYQVASDVFDDVEILERIGDIEENDELHLLPLLVRDILGRDGWSRWKESHRGGNGRVSAESLKSLLTDLFEGIAAGNSSASPTS